MRFKLSIVALSLVAYQLTLCAGEHGKKFSRRISAPRSRSAQSDPDTNALDNDVNKENHSNSPSQNSDKHTRQGRHHYALNGHGRPVPSLTASLTLGKSGDMLLKDVNFLSHLAHFDRERIPERVVHAKGAGAHGFFEVTHDISMYTRAALFASIGKRTPLFVRFSTVGGELGSADTALDPRGFATKFYTEKGNWDLVGNNLLVFPIRDPILFPSFIHSRKRHPQTHLPDANMFWDFTSLRPESTLHTLQLFSDLGYPDGYRFMHGGGVHTFKFVNKARKAVYVKFHWLSKQGVKNLTRAQAQMLAGSNPDYSTQDLFDAIDRREFPSWELNIQVMTFDQALESCWNPFDITKEWLTEDFPLIPVGKMTLDKNPKDYFTEIEMAAFDPGNLVPGIEMSPDRMLQGRSFSYLDTQRYRLGANFPQLSVNQPKIPDKLRTYERDGPGMSGPELNGNGAPNYFPNSYCGPAVDPEGEESEHKIEKNAEDVKREDVGEDDNFSQPKIFWEKMPTWERERLVDNLADHIKSVDDIVRKHALANFKEVDEGFGQQLKTAVEKKIAEAKLKSPGTPMRHGTMGPPHE